jgi:REP element-mobilizing transposase RayT
MTKFKNTWRIESTRLQHWDYGWNGNYFITICTMDRECFFGKIENHTMHLSETGKLAQQFWNEIPNHFPFVLLGAFVVMPNHVHGILTIDRGDGDVDGDGDGDVETRQCLVSTAKSYQSAKIIPNKPNGSINTTRKSSKQLSPGQKRFQNQGKNTVSSIIGSYKSIVTRRARKINPCFGWQSRFYDHIIRDDQSFRRIQQYIHDNPGNWEKDRFY